MSLQDLSKQLSDCSRRDLLSLVNCRRNFLSEIGVWKLLLMQSSTALHVLRPSPMNPLAREANAWGLLLRSSLNEVAHYGISSSLEAMLRCSF